MFDRRRSIREARPNRPEHPRLDRAVSGQRLEQALTAARSRKLRQIHFQDRHVESVGNLSVFFILEDDADEFAADMNFDRIRLRPLQKLDRVEPEKIAQIFFDAPTLLLPMVQSGKIKALAVTSPARMRELPQVPTAAESGVKEIEFSTWSALVAPAGTPPEVVSTLRGALAKVMATPEMREALVSRGFEPYTVAPDALPQLRTMLLVEQLTPQPPQLLTSVWVLISQPSVRLLPSQSAYSSW